MVEISYGENLQVARGRHWEAKFCHAHTCHLKSGKMADKTRDVSSRNGVARPRHRQRKTRPGIPSSTHLAEGIVPKVPASAPSEDTPVPTRGRPRPQAALPRPSARQAHPQRDHGRRGTRASQGAKK